ncbi:MAG: hypothetical protein IPK50_06055 [Fibrobacterota bacterium]|nr:hypothetical protein [Fibrobacterota bacterium]QQS06460.1 MAG: hypothetical protein IPK50_06055 [Fibrobacterota bacterium]
MNASSRTLAVVVLHGMDWADCPARASLERAGSELSVAVFGNGRAVVPALGGTVVQVADDGENPGVGPRYLQAARTALDRGDSFLLLLDQDFQAPAGWWEAYERAVASQPTVACWAPVLRNKGLRLSPFSTRRVRPDARQPLPGATLDTSCHGALNSGLLIRVESLLSAAHELQTAPLYFSDLAMFHRLGRSFLSMAVVALELEHDLSALSVAPPAATRRRFGLFCAGARGFASLDPRLKAPIRRWTILRAANLALHGTDPRFLGIWKKCFLDGIRPEDAS